MKVKYRSYQKEDSEKLIALLKVTGLFIEACDQAEIINLKSLEDPESIILAEIDDNIVGCIFINYDAWVTTLRHLGVHPDFQKRGKLGIALQLFKRAESLVFARGCPIAVGYVIEDNLVKLYKKVGFEVYPCKPATVVYKTKEDLN